MADTSRSKFLAFNTWFACPKVTDRWCCYRIGFAQQLYPIVTLMYVLFFHLCVLFYTKTFKKSPNQNLIFVLKCPKNTSACDKPNSIIFLKSNFKVEYCNMYSGCSAVGNTKILLCSIALQ